MIGTTMRPPELQNLHVLRGVAALMVVLLHSSEQFDEGLILLPAHFGNAGVDIFFVISGFMMVYVSDRRQRTALSFLRDRFLRIAPMYWFFTTLTVVLALIVPSAFRGTVFDPVHALLSYFFVAYPHPVNEGSLSPILRVGWTLNYEMMFYALFAFALALRPKIRVQIVFALLLALVVMRPLVENSTVGQFYTHDIILEFGIGMMLAVFWRKGVLQVLPVWIAVSLLLLGIAVLFVVGGAFAPGSSEHSGRALWFGLPAFAIVAAALSMEGLRKNPNCALIGLLGDASYVIYLSHPFVLTACRLVLSKSNFDTGSTFANLIAILGFCGGHSGRLRSPHLV